MLLSITSEAPSTAPCSFCLTRKHSSWSKKDMKTLTLHTKGTISSPLMLKSKLSLWKWNECCVWERARVYLKLCMFKTFVTWLLPKSLSSPSMSAKLVHAHLLGLFDGAEISAGRSPLMNEDLLLGKIGFVVAEASSGSWECPPQDEGALWVIWLQCDGDRFLLFFYTECFVVPHFTAPSSSGWKNISVDGKSRKQRTPCLAVPLENSAALLGPSVEEAYDDACFSSLGCSWDCPVSRNFLVSRV